jgi:hypothetical protein
MKDRNAKLDPKEPLFAGKDIRVSGRQYISGDPFTDSTASYRWKLKMWKAGFLVTVEDRDRIKASRIPAVEAPKEPEVVVQLVEDVAEDAELLQVTEERLEEGQEAVEVEVESLAAKPKKQVKGKKSK